VSLIHLVGGSRQLKRVESIAGAYAERVPILHIVGVPSTKLQKSKALLHHTLGDGSESKDPPDVHINSQLHSPEFNVFEESAKGVTAAQAFLQSAEGAAKEIDRVLRVALETARPTYLTLPTDLVFSPVLSSFLDTPIISPPRIDGDLILASGEVDEEQKKMKDFVVAEIVRLWDQSKNPIFLIDACAVRYGVTEMVQQLVDATGAKVSQTRPVPLFLLTRKLQYFTTPMGKSALP
jgi:pyruvate decarboxylase